MSDTKNSISTNEQLSNQTGITNTAIDNKDSEGNLNRQSTVQEEVNSKLQDAVLDDAGKNEENPLPQVGQSKKGLPKIVVFLVIFFLVIGLLITLFLKFRESGSQMFLGSKGEIVWWGVQHEAAVYQPLIDEFEKENPNIKIKYEKQSTKDYQVRLLNALSSATGPDIFEIHNTWPAMFRNELSTLPSSVMPQKEFNESFYPIIISNLTLDKGVVGMPLEYDALTLYINEDVFASALESPPITWSDLQSLSVKLTQRGSDKRIIQAGVSLGITGNVDHWPEILGLMLFQNGVNPGKPVGSLTSDVFSFYKSFSGAGVWDDTLPNSTSAFSRGELAMYFGPIRRASEIIKVNPNLKFRTVKLPQLPKNKPDDPDYSYATYWIQGVSEKSKVKEGSWTFLKFLAREDSLKKINDNITEQENIGRIYPRPGMNLEKAQDSVFGSVVAFSYDARSFYLADNTFDGLEGINTLVNNVYKATLDDWPSGGLKALDSTSQNLSQVLGKFGIRIR